MIKTLPNLKVQDNDGKIVYFDSLFKQEQELEEEKRKIFSP